MAYSPASGKAVTKYIEKNYDQVSLRIPKGMREVYKAQAESQGKSLNAYVVDLMDADMEACASKALLSRKHELKHEKDKQA